MALCARDNFSRGQFIVRNPDSSQAARSALLAPSTGRLKAMTDANLFLSLNPSGNTYS
jgi:hypothetical protein